MARCRSSKRLQQAFEARAAGSNYETLRQFRDRQLLTSGWELRRVEGWSRRLCST